MIYLGTPYSDPSPVVQHVRYQLAVHAAAILAEAQVPCYCPIASWHVAATAHNLPTNYEFWRFQDEEFMNLCSEGWFVRSEGWADSAGVHAEMAYLTRRKTPVIIHQDLIVLRKYASDWRKRHL